MKFGKKSNRNIFSEGLEKSVLHPYVKSSYNFVTEGLDDEVDVNSEDVLETPKPGVETGFSNMLIDAINGEWDTINLYNSIIATLSQGKDKKYDAIIKVLQDITNEENVHVGQLQKALELLSPNTASIADGEKEAQEQISADDYDDVVTESLLTEDGEVAIDSEQNSESQGDEISGDETTEEPEEEKSDEELLKELFGKENVDLKDAVMAERIMVTNSDDGSAKETLSDTILSTYGDDAIEPAQLEKFEDAAKSLGANVTIGEIAKKYGMEVEQVVDSIKDSRWSDYKIKLTLFSLSTALFTDAKQFLTVAQALVEKTSEESTKKALEEIQKLKSFSK